VGNVSGVSAAVGGGVAGGAAIFAARLVFLRELFLPQVSNGLPAFFRDFSARAKKSKEDRLRACPT
jgi:hypothetical protein